MWKQRILTLIMVIVLALPVMPVAAGATPAQVRTIGVGTTPRGVALAVAPNAVAPTGQEQALPLPVVPQPAATGSPQAMVTEALRSSPVMFIQNVGQFADGARFQVRGADKTIWLAEDAIWVTMFEQGSRGAEEQGSEKAEEHTPLHLRTLAPPPQRGVNLRLSFPGANPHPRIEPFNRLDTVVSYFIGNDPAKWRANVPVWGGVRYKDLYPGIDLEITSEGERLVQRLVARPGADLSAVRLRVEGADAVELLPSTSGREAGGEGLLLTTPLGDFTLPLLTVEGATPDGQPITFTLKPSTFDIASPFTSAPLLPSPASLPLSTSAQTDLLYSTFLGGSGDDTGYSIAVDASGVAYVTGATLSPDFPTTPGAFARNLGGSSDAFVVKLSLVGGGTSDLIYSTFLGGSSDDYGEAITLDGSGAVYITGGTNSSNFPTSPGAFDTSHNGDQDVFVVKLNASGTSLAYSTLLGGTGNDLGNGIAVDGDGAAYLTGWTSSYSFPTTPNAFDRSYNGCDDAFVVKLNAAGSALAYSTFLGGSGRCFSYEGLDWGESITVDSTGATYVAGVTYSSDFPTTSGAFDRSFNGNYDAFVVKLNPQGSDLIYSTFLGGSNVDRGHAIAVDRSGAVYVMGSTKSYEFPTTPGAFDRSYNGDSDVFVVKMSPVGSSTSDLVYSTLLGGSKSDWGYGIAVDSSGAVYVTGATYSINFPITPDAFDKSYNGQYDVFIVKMNPTGSGTSDLMYSTFLGGSGSEWSWGNTIAVDRLGNAYVTGVTESPDFPATRGAYDTTHNGYRDTFVLKVGAGPEVSTLMPELSPEDLLHKVILNGQVDPKGGTVQVWFEWGTDPDLTTYQITGTQTVAGTTQTVTATLSLPVTDSIGVLYYYRVAAGDPASPMRGNPEPFLLLLGEPNRGSVTSKPYWNKFDHLMHYYAHQQDIPPTLVKAIIALESAWVGQQNSKPERTSLYELVSVDWKKIHRQSITPTVPPALNHYLLPDHPGEARYNPYLNQDVTIPTGTKNLDMVGLCWIERSWVFGKEICRVWREKHPSFTPTWGLNIGLYHRLWGLTNPSPPSTPVQAVDAQYRLASSYGLGHILYMAHYDRAQRLLNSPTPPSPEDLWNPEINIRVAVDYLRELRNRCPSTRSLREKDYADLNKWEDAARAYNGGGCGIGYFQAGAWDSITAIFRHAQPYLAHRENLNNIESWAAEILSPTTRAMFTAQGSLLQAGEYEVDRLVANLKGTGQEQLATLTAIVSDPNQGVAYGVLRVFRDAAGTALEWESPPMEGVLASGVILTSTVPGGGAPLVIAYWGAGAHGTRAYLYRWDGQSFRPIRGKDGDGTEFTDFFGDAGVDIGPEGVWTGSRDGTEPLGVLRFDHYNWNPLEERFDWIGESTITLREFHVYLPLVLRNR